MKKKRWLPYAVNFAIVAVIYAIIQALEIAGMIDPYLMMNIKNILINVLLAVSLNLVTGFLGQLALGHAGFMSVGAYSAALMTINLPAPIYISLPVGLLFGGIMAAIFGIIIGIPALRLKGDYLAILTLGFGEIIRVVMNNLSITNGAKGLNGIPAVASLPVVYFVTVFSVAVIYTFINSRHGRAVIAIRDNEIAAEASGINTVAYKLFAFVMGAFFAGIAGGLYAHNIGVISPRDFDFNYSIEILIIVVLGGMGSVTGSVIAAVILTLVPQILSGFREITNYRMVIYALILIIMMLFRPKGLFGGYEFSLSRFWKKIVIFCKSSDKKKLIKEWFGKKEKEGDGNASA